jgi:hypothetical protein
MSRNRWLKRALAANILFVLLALPYSPASAGTVDVGAGWKATAPNGYDAAPDPPAGGNVGDLVNLGQSTTLALPVKLVVPNWQSLNEICITFTNDRKSTDPPPPDHLALSLDIVNKTNRVWGGFKMRITDNNNTPQDGQPNLTHPFYAHYHVHFLEANSVMPFTMIKTSPDYDAGPVAVGPDLTDRGVYSMEFSGGMVMKMGTWAPKVFDLHDRAKTNANGDYITSFTICLMPIPKIPEPATAVLIALGLLAVPRRRRRVELSD